MRETMAQVKKNLRHARESHSLLLATLTTFLLLGNHGCYGYMSTMHLGRALRAFSSADQQHLLDDRGTPDCTSYQLDGNSEMGGNDVDDAADSVVHDVSGAHPSWSGVQEEDSRAGEDEEEDQLSWSEELTAEEYTPAYDTVNRGSPSPQLHPQRQLQEEGGVTKDGELEQEESGSENQLTARAAISAPAADVVATAAAGTSLLAEDIAAKKSKQETRLTPPTLAASLDTGNRDFTSGYEEEEEAEAGIAALDILEVSSFEMEEIEEKLVDELEDELKNELEDELEEDLKEVLETELDEEPEDEPEDDLEDERLEDVELVAIRELLRMRDGQDQQVQEAAARTVEALPDKKKACFDDLKAFVFGDGQGEGGGLSEEDVRALDTVAICGDRDGVVLAFLRHAKFDLRKAKASIRRCCAWRRETEADNIFSRGVSPQKMRKHRTHWPTGFHKEDLSGRPVFYDRVGQSDLTALRADPDSLDQDEMVQIFCQNMEARRRFVLTRLSREAGRPVDQMTTVLDLTGLGVRHMSKEAISYTRRIGDIFQDNYSGMTCSLLVVNAPWVFSKGWQIIEGFLSEDTVAKVKVLGKGEAGLKKLETFISRENIPHFLGGESPAVVGPADPLWKEVDAAMKAWASREDPFLDRRAVRKVSARIERQRAAAAAAANEARSRRAKEEVEAQEESKREMSSEEIPDGSFEMEEEKEEMKEELVKETPAKVGLESRHRKSGPGRVREKHRAVKTKRGRPRHSQRTDHIRVGATRNESRRKQAKVSSRREGLDAKSRRRGGKKKTAEWEREEEGDRGVKDVRELEVGETALEVVMKKVFPVATAVIMKVFGAMVAAAKVFLSIVEGVFLFLRDTLFEQVEVDE